MFSVSGIFFACFVNIFRFDDIFYFWWFFLSFFANSFWQQADMDCIATKNISFCIMLVKGGPFNDQKLISFLYLRVHLNWFRNAFGIIFKFCPLEEEINWEISKNITSYLLFKVIFSLIPIFKSFLVWKVIYCPFKCT